MTRLSHMLVVTIIILFALVNTAVCATWVVDDDGGADFTSIQAAVDAANDGDMIGVRSGIYVENVNVNKQLTLIGEGADMVTVQAASADDFVFHVTAHNVKISGFEVTGATGQSKAGFCVYNQCNISGNKASNNDFGIMLWGGSNNNMLQNNNVSNNTYGIYLSTSSENTLTNNTASNNEWGISLSMSGDNTLTNNRMYDNTYNFDVYVLSTIDCPQNIDTSNTVDEKPIYYWVDQQDMQIPIDAGFVGVVNSTNITVRDLVLTNNSKGVFFAYVENSRIKNITALDNGHGISLCHSSSNLLQNNNVSNNSYGIYLSTSSENMLANNNASNNNMCGISLSKACNNILQSNTASNNNINGIELMHQVYNTTVYHNNLINNTRNAFDTGTNNQWDSGTEGNYYSDYTGTDSDGDGIGDTPYYILNYFGICGSVDRYPLMAPYIPPSDPQDKTLLQLEGHSEVYWLQNSKLYWVTDWDVINNMAGVPGWDSVNTLPISEFDPAAYTQGPSFITTGVESDGLLIRQNGDYKVYRIENGEKRHITYPDVMDLKGYSFDDVIEVSANILDMFPLGDPIGIEVDLYFNKTTNSGEESHVCQFTTGETVKIYTETTVTENYDVETYVRLTYPDGTTKKYAYHESPDFSPTDPLQFSETERPLYSGIWHAQTKIWNWNEYIFTGNEDEGIYTWEFWYKDVASGKVLGKDVQGYEFSITPPDPIDITSPHITILPVLGITNDGFTYYNSNVYISGTAFDPSGIKTLTVNGQGLWSIPVYGVEVFGSFINLNEGINEITISAIDNSENSNEKIEKININYYPYNVKINSPTDGSIFKEGDSIKLEGKVTGGTPQFDYEWLINGVVENFGTSNNGLIEHTLNGFALEEYKVRLKVTDFEGYVFETNEIQFFVKEPKPDLIVTDISFSKDNQEIKEAAEGEPITVTARIKNIGPVDVEGDMWVYFWQVSHYDKPDEKGDRAIVATYSGPGLASGQEVETNKITWNVGSVFTTQEGIFEVKIDPNDKINEIDNNNNNKFGKVDVTSRADFWPERDAYHFKNFEPSTDQKIDMATNVKAWFDLSRNPFGLSIDIVSLLGGSLCYGMSATNILYYEERLSKPVDKNVFDMLKTDKDVTSNILRYQAMQFPDLLFNMIIGLLPDYLVNVEDEFNKIEDSIKNGKYVVSHIRFYYENGATMGSHAVLPIGTYSKDKIKNVIVIDPNHPGMSRVIQFDFEKNKITYKDLKGSFEVHASYLSTAKPLVSISDGKKVLDVLSNMIYKSLFDIKSKLLMFKCPIDITIIDQYGRIIDNKGNNEIPSAKVNIVGDSKMFLLPADLDYTINIDAFDSGDFTFTQINPLTSEYASLISFVEVPITENTEAISDVSSTNPEYIVKIDYDGDGTIDEMIKPDVIDIVGANFYNITFLPPITTMDQFNLTDGSTLPIKFTVKNSTTDEFIYDDTVNVTITDSTGHLITYFTNGTGTDSVRIDTEDEQYIVNLHTKDYDLNIGEIYAVSVTFGETDSLRGYDITYFTMIEGGRGRGI